MVQTIPFLLHCDKGWHARKKSLFKYLLLYPQSWLSIIYLSTVMSTFLISSHQSPSHAEFLSTFPLSYLSETFGYYLKFYPGILWAICSVYWLNKAQTFKVSPNDSLWHFWEGRNERKRMKKRQGCMKEETWLSQAPTEKLKKMKFDIIFSSDDRVLASAFLWEVKIT